MTRSKKWKFILSSSSVLLQKREGQWPNSGYNQVCTHKGIENFNPPDVPYPVEKGKSEEVKADPIAPN